MVPIVLLKSHVSDGGSGRCIYAWRQGSKLYVGCITCNTGFSLSKTCFLAAATASLGILGAQYWGKGSQKDIR